MREVRIAVGGQERLAREIKCSINTVRRCEYDVRLPHNEAVLDLFKKVAKRVGIDVEDEASS